MLALAPLIISAAVAAVVTAQWLLARQKLRLDLFDRRFEVYQSLFGYYQALIGWTGSDDDKRIRDRFFMAYKTIPFLFKDESGLEDTYRKIADGADQVAGVKEHLPELRSDPLELNRLFQVNNNFLLTEFPDLIAEARKRMKPYLAFHRI